MNESKKYKLSKNKEEEFSRNSAILKERYREHKAGLRKLVLKPEYHNNPNLAKTIQGMMPGSTLVTHLLEYAALGVDIRTIREDQLLTPVLVYFQPCAIYSDNPITLSNNIIDALKNCGYEGTLVLKEIPDFAK